MSSPIYTFGEEIAATIDDEWRRLAAPGTWWRGEERVAIAAEARAARAGGRAPENSLSEGARSAIRTIATHAHEIDKAQIEAWHDQGVAPLPMVELLAITAKTATVDTFLRGVGQESLTLPEPGEGGPSQEEVEGAEINHGWLPTKGPAGAPNCFSAVEAEHLSLHEIHASFYLALTEMRDMDAVKELHRSQIELLAARTSYLNDCFY